MLSQIQIYLLIYEALTNLHSFGLILLNNSNYVLIYTVDKSTGFYLFYNSVNDNRRSKVLTR